VEKVEAFYERNKPDPERAFDKGVEWWSQLSDAPHSEDEMILLRAPRLKELLSPARIKTLDEDGFVEASSMVNAFRTHARQVENSYYGLAPDHYETEDQHRRECLAGSTPDANRNEPHFWLARPRRPRPSEIPCPPNVALREAVLRHG